VVGFVDAEISFVDVVEVVEVIGKPAKFVFVAVVVEVKEVAVELLALIGKVEIAVKTGFVGTSEVLNKIWVVKVIEASVEADSDFISVWGQRFWFPLKAILQKLGHFRSDIC